MHNDDARTFAANWLQSVGASQLDAFDAWLSGLEARDFRRGDYLVEAGRVDTSIYLIRSGLVRLFYLSSDGKERNKAFYSDGSLVGAMSAAIQDAPASFSIEAIEDTEVVSGSYTSLLAQGWQPPDRARVVINLLTDAFVRNERREAVLLTLNAEQRYRWLSENEAWLLDRVPQFHLASYLGMDAVTLSRVKANVKT